MDNNSDFNNISNENQNSDFDKSSLSNNNEFLDINEGEDMIDIKSEEGKSSENTIEKEEKKEDEKQNEKQNESKSSEHDGKYFVVQKGLACCDKGSKFPQFKVTSHQKHYWNDEEGKADYLVVTEDDLNFNPSAMPFGTCSIKNGNPCAFSPSGKWTKTYDKVKVSEKKCVTEISELLCAIGGKITVMKHGQQTEAGKSNVSNANSTEQQTYNPMMDFEEFKEEINESDQLYYK